MNEWYDKELERIELMQKDLHDRHNSEPIAVDKNQYKRIINAKIKIAPITGESWIKYVERIKVYQEIAKDLNWNTHVDNPYKEWHTHKNPAGCFMCNDIAMISVLVQVLECMAAQHPEDQFK